MGIVTCPFMLRSLYRPTIKVTFKFIVRPRVFFPNPPTYSMAAVATQAYAQEPVASSVAHQGNLATINLADYDPEQSKLMDERCIIVDENDVAIGALDKKTCKYRKQKFDLITNPHRPFDGEYPQGPPSPCI